MKAKIHSILFAFFAFFVVLIITSCENDIDLKADDTTGLLCINGNLTAGADDNVIYVAVTGKESANSVNNAKVVVSVNGSEVETINGSSTNRGDSYYEGYGIYNVDAKFNPGDYVQVDVYYGEQHAYGGGVVPQPVKDLTMKVGYKENVSYKEHSWSESNRNSDMVTMGVTFADSDPSAKNYYRMAVTQSDSVKMRVDENGHYLNPRDGQLQGANIAAVVNEQAVYDEYERWGYYDDYRKYGYYFDNDPILSAEVVKSEGDLSFMEAVDNVYKIFNDNFFNGSQATLNVMCTSDLYGKFSEDHPEKYYYSGDSWGDYVLLHDIDYYAPRYTHRNYVDVYSITDDEFYYLKVLNARGPDSFFEWDDGMSLTGDVKLPSNVKGGTGNIFVSSCVKITACLFEDYIPEYGGEPENNYIYYDDNYGDPDYYYYNEK